MEPVDGLLKTLIDAWEESKRPIIVGLLLDIIVLAPLLAITPFMPLQPWLQPWGALKPIFVAFMAVAMMAWALVAMKILIRTGYLRRMALWSGIITSETEAGGETGAGYSVNEGRGR